MKEVKVNLELKDYRQDSRYYIVFNALIRGTKTKQNHIQVSIKNNDVEELIQNVYQGNLVKIKKEDVPKELNKEIGIDKFEILSEGDLEFEKYKIKRKTDNFIKLSESSHINFYTFIYSFTKLFSKGYVITDETREEKYLEILSTNDESLISLLEEYLTSMDSIAEIEKIFRIANDCNKKIDKVESIEELNIEKEKLNKIYELEL